MLPFTLLYSLTVLLSDPKLGLALIRQAKCLPFITPMHIFSLMRTSTFKMNGIPVVQKTSMKKILVKK